MTIRNITTKASLALAFVLSAATPLAVSQAELLSPIAHPEFTQSFDFNSPQRFDEVQQVSARVGFRRGGLRGGSFRRGGLAQKKLYKRGFQRGRFARHGRGFNRSFGGRRFVTSQYYGFSPKTVVIGNYASYGLYAPPVGYSWVYDKGASDAVLASLKTGKIIARAPGLFR